MNKIITHGYFKDSFNKKALKIITYKDNKAIAEDTRVTTSSADFQTLLGEVKQFNNDPTNQQEKRIKRIINII